MNWDEKVEIGRVKGKDSASFAAFCKHLSHVFILSQAITESLRK